MSPIELEPEDDMEMVVTQEPTQVTQVPGLLDYTFYLVFGLEGMCL